MSGREIPSSKASALPKTFSLASSHELDALLTEAEGKSRDAGSLMGFVFWAAKEAGYRKILGLPLRPQFAFLDGKMFDFTTVEFRPNGVIQMKMRKPTKAELARIRKARTNGRNADVSRGR
jgi:hypothetical protein